MDPYHRYQRLELDGAVYDANEPGLIVIYRVESDGTISFVTSATSGIVSALKCGDSGDGAAAPAPTMGNDDADGGP